MTNYGTIPTTTAASAAGGSGSGALSIPYSNLAYISRARDRIQDGIGTLRPWKSMLNLHSLSIPKTLADAISRLKTNSDYFRMNYALITLGILFLSLLWHPISLIVFIAAMAAWLYLYFLRDEPIVVFGKLVDDRIVLGTMSVVTAAALLLTGVLWNVLGSVLVGAAVVAAHGVVRRTEDLFVDEDSAGFLAAGSRSSS
ncbi:PRA1 family protein F2 [Linum grandiflorum]